MQRSIMVRVIAAICMASAITNAGDSAWGQCDGSGGCDCGGAVLCDDAAICSCDGSTGCDDGCLASSCLSLSCLTSSRCEPLWTVTADALFLDRSDPSSGYLVNNYENSPPNPPAPVMNMDDFDFGRQTGLDLTLTRKLRKCRSIQFRYFGVDDWDDSQLISTTPNELLGFEFDPPEFVQSGDNVASTYASKLHNFEINITREVSDWLGLLAGFRYVELDEQGITTLPGAAIPYAYGVQTTNRLYGGQLGMDASLWCNDTFSLDASGRAGIYGNHLRHRAFTGTPVAQLLADGPESRASFVGEIAVTGAAKLTDRLGIRGGYRLLWLDGVALAEEQFAVSDFFNGTGVDDSGDVFYHGAFVGIELVH